MKISLLIILLHVTSLNICNGQIKPSKKAFFIGINLRELPIEIENLSNGSDGSKDAFYHYASWRAWSLFLAYGFIEKNQLSISLQGCFRYNHLHYNKLSKGAGLVPRSPTGTKRLKSDLFIIANQKLRKLNKKINYSVGLGIGFSNLNTKYDISFYDTVALTGIIHERNYSGTFRALTPKLELSAHCKRFNVVTEVQFLQNGDSRQHLNALWIGFTFAYNIRKRL